MKSSWHVFLWTAALVAVSATRALADDERTFVLKNGRSVVGEVVEETETGFTLRVAGGSIHLARDEVARVEKRSPPAASSPSEPSSVGQRFVDPSSTDRHSPKTEAPPADGRRPIANTARSLPGGPFVYTGAPASVVSACRSWLDSTAQAPEVERPALLKKALTDFGVKALLTIMDSTRGPVGPDPTLQRDARLAADAVRSAGAGAREELIEALAETNGAATELLPLIELVFDTSAEAALLDLLPKVHASFECSLLELLGQRGGTRSAEVLVPLLLAVSDRQDTRLPRCMGECFAAIVRREEAARRVAWSLANAVMMSHALPPGTCIDGLTIALAAAPKEALPALQSIASRVEGETIGTSDDDSSTALMLDRRRASVYRALASTGAPEALDVVERAVANETDSGRRAQWIVCLKSAKAAPDMEEAGLVKLVASIVSSWEKHPEDGEAASETLTTLTGKSLGPAFGPWRAYSDECTKKPER